MEDKKITFYKLTKSQWLESFYLDVAPVQEIL